MGVRDMRHSILLVDDDESFLDLISNVLENAGYRVATASCCDSAVESARQNRPDLILLDINMPCLDGFDLCEMLQGDHVPILFVSGLPFRDQSDRVAYSGAAGYIEKPVRPDVLLARVKDAFVPAGSSP